MTPPPDLHKAAQAAHIALTCISTHPTLDISDYLRRRVDAAAAGLESALSAVPAQPVAWLCGDGHPHHISAVQTITERRIYGPRQPLYAAPQAVPVPVEWRTALDEALSLAIGHAATYQFNHSLAELHPTHADIIARARALLAAAPKEQP